MPAEVFGGLVTTSKTALHREMDMFIAPERVVGVKGRYGNCQQLALCGADGSGKLAEYAWELAEECGTVSSRRLRCGMR